MKGSIIDQDGNTIAPFESGRFGLGSVGLTPIKGASYFAEINLNGNIERFPLPKALPNGYRLGLKNRGDHILVQLASTMPTGLKGTILVGHLRGEPIFKRIATETDGKEYATKIYTDALKDGVAQFTLFSPDGEPYASAWSL